MLRRLCYNQINLTKLESFSVKNTFDQTNFYLDLEGHIEERIVQKLWRN